MASEIRVNKITHTAGVGTITTSADGVVIAGIVTANSFSGDVTGAVTGSGANLTSIPAGQLTGTVADARLTSVTASKLSGALPAIDGSALTGVGASFGNSSVNTSGIITATAFVPSQGQLSHRNLIINGDMNVALRGASSTTSGYGSVDRFSIQNTGTDEAPTHAQVDVASGTTPYTLGFRKGLKITNGNQTSGAGAGDYIKVVNKLEAQDIANSGWNYKSASSFITLSYWVKSSVAQTFFVRVTALDSPVYNFPFSYSVSANTWTKVTKAIPGNSNLVFNDDNGTGLDIEWTLFRGTNTTGSGATLDTWAAYDSSQRQPDNTSTWYTTNDATWEITGVQLEVGSVATPFEHLPHSENKRRCYRYCQRGRHVSSCLVGTPGTYYFSRGNINLFTPMRATVTGTLKAATWNSNRYFKYMTWSSETNVTAAPASTTFASGNISDATSDILSVNLHISISSGSSNSPLPANGPGSNNVYPIEYFDVLLEAEL